MGIRRALSDANGGEDIAAVVSAAGVFNGLRYLTEGGRPWRLIPHELPPWDVVYQQTQRCIRARVFEAIVQDLRKVLRLRVDRKAQSSAAFLDSRTLQSTPKIGGRCGYDGGKRRNGGKVNITVDTLGHLLAVQVTPAHEKDRA